jgi:3',5'-cyclic AMP phosphodiesterase CpdA
MTEPVTCVARSRGRLLGGLSSSTQLVKQLDMNGCIGLRAARPRQHKLRFLDFFASKSQTTQGESKMRRVLVLIVVVLMVACARPPVSDPRVDAVIDRLAVQDAVNELFVATDLKDWDRVRATFAGRVLFDMTSMVGGQPVELTPEAIADSWAQALGPVQAVHHQTGNYVIEIDGDAASVSCYGTATHFRPDQEKRLTYFVGSYDFHLVRRNDGWKIDQFKFNAKYAE